MTALDELLRHPDLASAVVLAGPTDNDVRVVHSVTPRMGETSVQGCLSTVEGEENALSGSAVVITARGVRPDWHFDVLLRMLGEAGATMLVTDIDRAGLLASTKELANRFGIALLTSDDPVGLALTLSALLADDHRRADRRVLDIVRIGENGRLTFDEAVDAVGRVLGRTVLVLDAEGAVVRGGEDISRIPEAERLGGTSGSRLIDLGDGRLVVAAPVMLDQPGLVWLGALVRASLAAEHRELLPLIEAGALVCSHAGMLTRLRGEGGARERRGVIEDLAISDPDTVRAELRRRVASAGWDLTGTHVVIRILCSPAVDVVSMTRAVLAELKATGLELECAEQTDGWFVWFDPGSESTPPVEVWQRELRRLNLTLREHLTTSIGISRARQGLGGFIRSLGEADDASRIAADRPQSGHFVVADRLGLEQLLLAWTSADNFTRTVGSMLERLDQASPALKPTLKAFLDEESHFSATAAVLGVHRNTVTERIRRIEEVLDVDLADPETRLALHLACRTDARPQTAQE